MAPPNNTAELHPLGDYFADYTPLTAEELAAKRECAMQRAMPVLWSGTPDSANCYRSEQTEPKSDERPN